MDKAPKIEIIQQLDHVSINEQGIQMSQVQMDQDNVGSLPSEITVMTQPLKSSKRRKQRYRKDWELNDAFRGWLTSMSSSPYLAFCKACKSTIQAHKKDITLHSRSKKHERNMSIFVVSGQFDQIIYNDPKRESSSFQSDEYEEQVVYEAANNGDDTFFSETDEPDAKAFFQHPSPKGKLQSQFNLNKGPIIIEKCSRWCCQNPDAPPMYEDAASVFGKFVGDELRSMTNDYERQKVKMKINKVLFNACIGKYDTIESNFAKTIGSDYSIPQLAQPVNDDQMAGFGKYLANELKTIVNTNARQIAKLKICTILCQATIVEGTYPNPMDCDANSDGSI